MREIINQVHSFFIPNLYFSIFFIFNSHTSEPGPPRARPVDPMYKTVSCCVMGSSSSSSSSSRGRACKTPHLDHSSFLCWSVWRVVVVSGLVTRRYRPGLLLHRYTLLSSITITITTTVTMLLVSVAVSSSLLVTLVLALPEPEAGLGAEHVVTLSRCSAEPSSSSSSLVLQKGPLLRHYAKRTLTPQSLNVKLGPRRKGHKGRAVWLA